MTVASVNSRLARPRVFALFARGLLRYNAAMETQGRHPEISERPRGGASPSSLHRRLRELGYLSMPLFGFAFVRAFNDLSFSRAAHLFEESAWTGQDLLSLTMAAVFLLGVLFARRLAPLWDRRPAVLAVTVFMVVSGLLQGLGSADHSLVVAGLVLGGIGTAVHILLWAEMESCLNTLRIALYVSGGFFLGDLLGWVLQDAAAARGAVALALLPLLSLGCLSAAFASVPREDRPAADWGAVRFPWRLVAMLGVYEFVLGFNEASVGADEGTMFLLGALAAAGGLFAAVFFLSHRFDLALMFRTPFLFVACGLLATFLSMGQTGAFSEFLVAVGYGLMFLVLTILLCDISHRFGVSVLLLCGVEELMALFMVAGHKVAPLLGSDPGADDAATLRVILVAVVIGASALGLFGAERKQWGVALFGVGPLAGAGSERERVLARCAVLAEAYGLSPREGEVFQLIALGKSPVSIECELCIAQGTLKSHTQRIYQKLGVHSRDELHALVGEKTP